MIGLLLILAIILIAGCTQTEAESVPPTQGTETQNEVSQILPPSQEQSNTVETVATVNGIAISSQDVVEIEQELLMQGQTIPRDEIISQLIDQELLMQSVRNLGIEVTQAQAEEVITEQLALQGATLEQYQAQLEMQGVLYSDELARISEQIAVQTYISQQIPMTIEDVTEEEALAFYETVQADSVEELPPFADVREQIIAILQEEQEQQAITAHIAGLRETAEITYN